MHDSPPAGIGYKSALSKQDERALVVPPAFTSGAFWRPQKL